MVVQFCVPVVVFVYRVPFFTTILFGKLFFRWCHAGFFLFSISAKQIRFGAWNIDETNKFQARVCDTQFRYDVFMPVFFFQWPATGELKSLNWTRIATFENAVRPVSKLQVEVSGTKSGDDSIFSTLIEKQGAWRNERNASTKTFNRQTANIERLLEDPHIHWYPLIQIRVSYTWKLSTFHCCILVCWWKIIPPQVHSLFIRNNDFYNSNEYIPNEGIRLLAFPQNFLTLFLMFLPW